VTIVHAWLPGETLLKIMVWVVEVLVSPSRVMLQSLPAGRSSSLNVKVQVVVVGLVVGLEFDA